MDVRPVPGVSRKGIRCTDCFLDANEVFRCLGNLVSVEACVDVRGDDLKSILIEGELLDCRGPSTSSAAFRDIC